MSTRKIEITDDTIRVLEVLIKKLGTDATYEKTFDMAAFLYGVFEKKGYAEDVASGVYNVLCVLANLTETQFLKLKDAIS